VKLFVLPSARTDIREQIEFYLEYDLSHIGDRFQLAVDGAISAVGQRPNAGSPRHFRNPALGGLRAWPVKGFDQFHIYYLARQDVLMIVRVLHDKRDIGAILEKQIVDDPDID
jgi:toxin ParE1/3/4